MKSVVVQSGLFPVLIGKLHCLIPFLCLGVDKKKIRLIRAVILIVIPYLYVIVSFWTHEKSDEIRKDHVDCMFEG